MSEARRVRLTAGARDAWDAIQRLSPVRTELHVLVEQLLQEKAEALRRERQRGR